MELNVFRLLNNAGVPFEYKTELNLSERDFPGFYVSKPVDVFIKAKASGGMVAVDLDVNATIEGDCVRCLQQVELEQVIHTNYRVTEEELTDDYPELPIMQGGNFDVEELVYGELVIEADKTMLCKDDCQGLCQRCGNPKTTCDCEPVDEQPQGDPRLQVLRELLTDDDEKDDNASEKDAE